VLGDWDKGIELVYGEEKEKKHFYWDDYSSQGSTQISCTGTTSTTN
jgi:hypothetical protein